MSQENHLRKTFQACSYLHNFYFPFSFRDFVFHYHKGKNIKECKIQIKCFLYPSESKERSK